MEGTRKGWELTEPESKNPEMERRSGHKGDLNMTQVHLVGLGCGKNWRKIDIPVVLTLTP
jgi:hypothetical protein